MSEEDSASTTHAPEGVAHAIGTPLPHVIHRITPANRPRSLRLGGDPRGILLPIFFPRDTRCMENAEGGKGFETSPNHLCKSVRVSRFSQQSCLSGASAGYPGSCSTGVKHVESPSSSSEPLAEPVPTAYSRLSTLSHDWRSNAPKVSEHSPKNPPTWHLWWNAERSDAPVSTTLPCPSHDLLLQ